MFIDKCPTIKKIKGGILNFSLNISATSFAALDLGRDHIIFYKCIKKSEITVF